MLICIIIQRMDKKKVGEHVRIADVIVKDVKRELITLNLVHELKI